MRNQLLIVACSAVALFGCASGGSSSNGNGSSSGPSTSAPANPAQVITVSAGQTTSGADIAVGSPQASPAINATTLGANDFGSTGSAFNSGDSIARGASRQVLVFGPGLSGAVTISLSGPADITISNEQSITATDKTPGVSFDVAVSPTAALGARTVLLKNAQNDITTFTGGLEVTP